MSLNRIKHLLKKNESLVRISNMNKHIIYYTMTQTKQSILEKLLKALERFQAYAVLS